LDVRAEREVLRMLNLLWLTYVSFMAAISGAVVPGPVFIVTVSEALKKGKIAGPLIVVGHLTLEALIIAALLTGLKTVLSSEVVRTAVGYAGGAALIVMGSMLMKAAVKFDGSLGLEGNPSGGPGRRLVSHGLVASGILSSGSNPQFYIWWLTVGLSVMQYCLSSGGISGFAAFILGHASADLLWFGFVSYSVESGKRLMNQRVVRFIIVGSALFLILFGAAFIYQTYIY